MLFYSLSILITIAILAFLGISTWIFLFEAAPYVPSSMKSVKKVLKNADIKKGDKFYDLGAGDGRTVHLASSLYGANAVGYELNFFIYLWAKVRQWISGWKGKMVWGNFLKKDLSDADVIFCYLLPNKLEKYQNKFEKELEPGTKVVSLAFHIGDWEAKKIIPKQDKIPKIWIYEV